MKKNMKKAITAGLISVSMLGIGAGAAYGVTFGTSSNGASSVEVLQVKYDGAAWNYSGSGYKNASFKYTRNGRTLLSKTATNGKVTGSVWDDLIRWGDQYKTVFTWSHQK